MTKREFIMQYILNRALGNSSGLDGPGGVREGAKAWDELEKVAPIKVSKPWPTDKDSSAL